jgi:hypothetical protein
MSFVFPVRSVQAADRLRDDENTYEDRAALSRDARLSTTLKTVA